MFVGGAQHIVQVLDADTNTLLGYHTTGLGCNGISPADCSPRYVGGGDFQVLETIDGYVLGGCHCYGVWSNQNYAGIENYNSFDDKRDGNKFVIPLNASTGGDASDWVPDLGTNARYGTWAIFADDNGCLYIGGAYKSKGPLGSGAWLGGFGVFCAPGEMVEITNAFSASARAILAWDEPAMIAPVEKYRIYRDGIYIGSTTGLTYTDTGLTPDDVHDYTIEAVDERSNRSPLSDPASITVAPIDVTDPAAPTDLTNDLLGDTTATISWTAAIDDQAVKTYLVYVGRTLAADGLDFEDSGLTPGDTYRYQVRAKDYGNNSSALSSPLFVTTTGGPGPDTTPPSIPAPIVAVTGDQTATISWDASTDDDSGVKAYLVYRDYIYIGRTLAADGLDFTDTGVTNGQTYRYHIRAKDVAGNVSASSTPVFATPEPPA